MLLGTLGGKGTIRAGEGTVRTYFERNLKIHRKKIYKSKYLQNTSI